MIIITISIITDEYNYLFTISLNNIQHQIFINICELSSRTDHASCVFRSSGHVA